MVGRGILIFKTYCNTNTSSSFNQRNGFLIVSDSQQQKRDPKREEHGGKCQGTAKRGKEDDGREYQPGGELKFLVSAGIGRIGVGDKHR